MALGMTLQSSGVCIPGNADDYRISSRIGRHITPDSLSAFWRIVSFTDVKTSRTLFMSGASVMLRSSEGKLRHRREYK
jgi:hypothetical protein